MADGEDDIGTEFVLAETLARAIALDDADLVSELSEVQFIGAATLDMVSRGRIFLRARSRDLTLRCPSARARRVIEILRLAGLVDPDSSTQGGERPPISPQGLPARRSTFWQTELRAPPLALPA